MRLNETYSQIDKIITFIVEELPVLKSDWIKDIKAAIEKAHSENFLEKISEYDDERRAEVLFFRDSHWPDAITYLESLDSLLIYIYSYKLRLKDFIDTIGQPLEKPAQTSLPASTTRKAKVTQRQLALFYYYCHETSCLPPFPAGEMQQAYKQATKPFDLAWKPFQQHYSRFKSRSERLATGSRKALLAAIGMLVEHPEALQLANDELVIAETCNPLT